MERLIDTVLAASVAGGSFTAVQAAQDVVNPTAPSNNVLAIATALITGVIAPLVKEWVIDHRKRRREKKQKKHEHSN